MSATERDRALARLTKDFETFWVVEVSGEVVALARAALVGHSLRAGDALQLASAHLLRRELAEDVPMVVFDVRLAAAATAQGIPVIPAPRSSQVERVS